MASIDNYNNIATSSDIPLDALDHTIYQDKERSTSYPYSLCKDLQDEYNEEGWCNSESHMMPDPQEIPKVEAKEDLYGHNSDMPKYADAAEYPEIPENEEEDYDWPTTGMAGLIAEEYWNPKMTRLEDNKPSSMLHDQMTSEEVYEWLQEPSDQVVFDQYNWPNREDNKKWQRLHRLELWRNYWTGDLGPDF